MKDDVKLAKWLEGSMNEAELREFMALPEFDTYRKIKEYSAELTAPEADLDVLYQKIERNRNRDNNKGVKKLTPWFARIAAVLFIALGLSYFFYTTHTTKQFAAQGEHTQFMLPDNSTVMLNSGSNAEFRSWNWDSNREIQLEGEAYFKVAKGKKFDVVTPLGTVTVVGTQFNVKARDGRFYVTCFEGKVKVASKDNEVLLTPGQSIIFEDGRNIASPTAEGAAPGWLSYDIAFESEPLENVIAEMERQYNTEIELPKGTYKAFHGHLQMNKLTDALEQIELIYNLKAKRADGKIILTRE